MINITLQRNDNKSYTDRVSTTEDTITINEQSFEFKIGKDITFKSPHEQIINPYRDKEGVLHVTVIKQYVKTDKKVVEACDEEGHYCQCTVDDIPQKKSRSKPIIAEILQEEIKEKTVSELITEKEYEIQILKDEYLDADLDDNETLKADLKTKIQELKKEVEILKDSLKNESSS